MFTQPQVGLQNTWTELKANAMHLVGHEVREIQVYDDALPALQGGSQALALVLVLCLTILRSELMCECQQTHEDSIK